MYKLYRSRANRGKKSISNNLRYLQSFILLTMYRTGNCNQNLMSREAGIEMLRIIVLSRDTAQINKIFVAIRPGLEIIIDSGHC